jgi:hypothetical protein
MRHLALHFMPHWLSRLRVRFHDSVELGPAMLARIARHTGLAPADL